MKNIKYIVDYKDTFIVLLLPIVAFPLCLLDGKNDIGRPGCCHPSELLQSFKACPDEDICEFDSAMVGRFGYSLIIIGGYWVTECLPIPLTALLPYVLYPFLGLADSGSIASNYIKNTNFLLIGAIATAIALETSQLHLRIAIGTLKMIGCSPRRLLFGTVFISWFSSMWMVNTAATSMIIPIVMAIINELRASKSQIEKTETNSNELEGVENKSFEVSDMSRSSEAMESEYYEDEVAVGIDQDTESESDGIPKDEITDFERGIILSVPYSCSIGGTALLTGVSANLILQEIWMNKYPEAPYQISFVEWLGYNIVNSAVVMLFVFLYLQAYFVGIRCKNSSPEESEIIERTLDNSSKKLRKVNQEEILVALSFIFNILLWIFRDPGFMPGWASIFPRPEYITDGVTATLIAISLFILPAGYSGLFGCDLSKGPSRSILNWKQYETKMSWGVILLIGGGYALASVSDSSGFSIWIAGALENFVRGWPRWAVALMTTVFSALLTEICSITASAALMLPLLAELATQLCIHPLYILLPTTLACSLSFMLPAATPANAVAYGTGKLTVFDMVKSGAMANIIGILFVNIMLNTWGVYYWDLNSQDFRNWTDTQYCPEL